MEKLMYKRIRIAILSLRKKTVVKDAHYLIQDYEIIVNQGSVHQHKGRYTYQQNRRIENSEINIHVYGLLFPVKVPRKSMEKEYLFQQIMLEITGHPYEK